MTVPPTTGPADHPAIAPAGDPAAQPADDVAARYAGRRGPGRRTTRIAAGVALAALGVAFVWWATAATRTDLHWNLLTFQVSAPDQVDVRFAVHGSEGDRVRCVIVARGGDLADAGQVEIDLGPLPEGGDDSTTVSVRTITPPVSAEVRTCVLIPTPLS